MSYYYFFYLRESVLDKLIVKVSYKSKLNPLFLLLLHLISWYIYDTQHYKDLHVKILWITICVNFDFMKLNKIILNCKLRLLLFDQASDFYIISNWCVLLTLRLIYDTQLCKYSCVSKSIIYNGDGKFYS